MIEDTSPLGKSVEEIERDSGNLDPDRNADEGEGVQGGVIIPPMGLGGTSGTAATGTATGVPMMPIVESAERTDGDENI
ncbi:hypothetical protein DAETH_12100 [Deinococcus aetherius]|uniref:Uncharacterized protein n=1 Tax=Deinococcus aetherius TaxID=200252 RepID=A0ABN6RG77_9DEIO|nr:hypothetical protein [Deinococcus aetherius]BDP41241.1 hypothetical protein DAETH_12100 [Deinococcus aetherius]